jgi:hypothetical protein
MKKLDVKNIIKYVAMSGYLLTSGCLWGTMRGGCGVLDVLG